jgi:hypothetical protein
VTDDGFSMLDSKKDLVLCSRNNLAVITAADKCVLAMVIFNQLQDAFFVFRAWFFICWIFIFR